MRKLTGTLAALTLAMTPLAGAPSAHADPDAFPTYVLPGKCVFPESIAVRGGKFYVGSACNSKLYVGDLRDRRAKVLVDSPDEFIMGGIEATANRLVVTRAASSFTDVYNRFTGELVVRFTNGRAPGRSIINDVAVTPNGDAYLTEFDDSRLYRIAAAELQVRRSDVQPLPVFLDFDGTAFPTRSGSANGIAATPDGKYLIVAHYDAGRLYRVRLRDKQVTRIDLHGARLAGPDGIELASSDVLYVVEFLDERIAEIRLSDRYKKGKVVSRTTSPLFDCPTAAAIAGDRLLVANSQFCNGEDWKPPFTVASIPLP